MEEENKVLNDRLHQVQDQLVKVLLVESNDERLLVFNIKKRKGLLS